MNRLAPHPATRAVIAVAVGVFFAIPLVSTLLYTVKMPDGSLSFARWASLVDPKTAATVKPIWTGLGNSLVLCVVTVAIVLLLLAPLILACALVGGLAFAFTGGIGAALSLGARRGGLLTAVIVLPLFVAPVIFGGGALDSFANGLPWRPGFALLGAYAASAVALGPLAMAAACRTVGATARDFTVASVMPTAEDPRGGHRWLVELEGGAPPLDRLAAALDAAVAAASDDYASHRVRDFGMRPPVVEVLAPGTFYAWAQKHGKVGGQHKVPRVALTQAMADELHALSKSLR